MRPPKVEKIEIDESHFILKVILFVIFLAVGITGIVFGVRSCTQIESGWTTINVDTKDGNCSNEFIFKYKLGARNRSAKDEKTALSAAYTDYTVYTFREFNADTLFDNTKNVAYINAHPNEEVSVSNLLYNSLKSVVDNGSKYLFYAPIFYEYQTLLSMSNEADAKSLDPNYSTDQAEYFQQIIGYISDENNVSLSILPNNKVKLNVSNEYLSFLEENNVTNIIDFYRLKNAYIIDFMVENLKKFDFTDGYFMSIDGYFVNMGEQEVSTVLTKLEGSEILNVGNFTFNGASSVIMYHSYPLLSSSLYRIYKDKKIFNTYVGKNGLYQTSTNTMFVYNKAMTCSMLALETYYVFSNDTMDVSSIKNNINYCYVENNKVFTNDDSMPLSINDGYTIELTLEC